MHNSIQTLRKSVCQSDEKVRAELTNWIEKSWTEENDKLEEFSKEMSKIAQGHLKELRALGATLCHSLFMKDCGNVVRDQFIEAE